MSKNCYIWMGLGLRSLRLREKLSIQIVIDRDAKSHYERFFLVPDYERFNEIA